MFLPFRHKLLNLVWEYNGLFFIFSVEKVICEFDRDKKVFICFLNIQII
jgi:hypothetical protein